MNYLLVYMYMYIRIAMEFIVLLFCYLLTGVDFCCRCFDGYNATVFAYGQVSFMNRGWYEFFNTFFDPSLILHFKCLKNLNFLSVLYLLKDVFMINDFV